MASMLNLQFHSVSFQPRIICLLKHHQTCLRNDLGFFCSSIDWNNKKNNHHRSRISFRRFVVRELNTDSQDDNNKNSIEKNDIQIEVTASKEENTNTNVKINNVMINNLKNRVSRLKEAVLSLPPLAFVMRRQSAPNFAIGLSILATILVIATRTYVVNKSRRNKRPGTVADLVRRGQLKSDTRGISAPLKYDDPFNNPMVKIGKSNSTVEMCGKVYRMAPVTLTKEQQAIHQKRRSRAYEWKRPTVFLKEGDPIPLDVDPETIRWIPKNHPFATTVNDIDENLAQNNVNLKHGVPFRVQAEHEALQKKLEALQSEQKLNKLVIDPSDAKEFGRPFKAHQRSDELAESNTSNSSPSGNGSTSKEEEFPKT